MQPALASVFHIRVFMPPGGGEKSASRLASAALETDPGQTGHKQQQGGGFRYAVTESLQSLDMGEGLIERLDIESTLPQNVQIPGRATGGQQECQQQPPDLVGDNGIHWLLVCRQ